MQYFTTQLRDEHDRTRSLRASQYKKGGKHAKKDDEDESPAGAEADVETHANPGSQSYAAFAAPEIAQLRVAGLLPKERDDVPPAPFPHAPARAYRDDYGPANVQEEMAKSPSRLYAAHATPKGDAVLGQRDVQKKTQINILSTLMHRCLLEGDYHRAGRAWGMILRTQIAGGRPVDPRNHGRWGVGAEIALRRKPHTVHGQQLESQSTEADRFSEEGFARAREYYDRLIVQYPHRRVQPHAVDERTFYAPMFSLWIYEVYEKSKRARLRLQSQVDTQSRSSPSMSSDRFVDEGSNEAHVEEDAIELEELTQAMEIANRLDEVIGTPPFDKQINLLQLRGNVALWISDLTVGKTVLDDDWDAGLSGLKDKNDSVSPAEQLRRLTKAETELQQARAFFQRAAANGAHGQAATMSSINLKLREYAKQLKRLSVIPQDE